MPLSSRVLQDSIYSCCTNHSGLKNRIKCNSIICDLLIVIAPNYLVSSTLLGALSKRDCTILEAFELTMYITERRTDGTDLLFDNNIGMGFSIYCVVHHYQCSV